jgi:hypothetical protein
MEVKRSLSEKLKTDEDLQDFYESRLMVIAIDGQICSRPGDGSMETLTRWSKKATEKPTSEQLSSHQLALAFIISR